MAFWALGYVSGANVFFTEGKDSLKEVDADAIWSWLDNYCRSHPLEKFADSVQNLTIELQARTLIK